MTYDKNLPIKDFWQGTNLANTKQHIINYIENRDSDYFAEHLYQPFLCLINTIYIKVVVSKNPSLFKDFDECLNSCFEIILKSLKSYNSTKNPYSYFYKVIKNCLMVKMMREYYKKRDVNKTLSLDGLEEAQRRALEPSYDPTEFYNILENYKEKLESNLSKKLIVTEHQIKYLEFLKKVAAGQIEIPMFENNLECFRWMAEQTETSQYQLHQNRRLIIEKWSRYKPCSTEEFDKRMKKRLKRKEYIQRHKEKKRQQQINSELLQLLK